MHRDGGRYSHRVWSSAAVALLPDDRCAEVLGVGERESVERLQRWQTTANSVPPSQTISYLVYLEEILFMEIHVANGGIYPALDTVYIWQLFCEIGLCYEIFHSWTSKCQYGTIHKQRFNMSTVSTHVRLLVTEWNNISKKIATIKRASFPWKAERWGWYKTAGQPNTCLALCKVTRSFQAERGTPQGLLIAIVKHCRDEIQTIRLLYVGQEPSNTHKHTLKRK